MKPFSLAGLFGFALLLSGCGDEPQPAPPRPVLTVTVKTLKNDDLGRFAGSIQARYESVLGFRTNGRIASRLFDVGDFVGAARCWRPSTPPTSRTSCAPARATWPAPRHS